MAESEPECLRLNSAISLPPRLCAKHAHNRRRRKRLRAKVALSGGFAYTRALGGRVKNASGASDATQGSAVSFVSGNASPRVETEIVASDPRPSGATDVKFGWQRCPNTTSPHTDCVYITVNWHRMSYTPVAADVGNYLRMYAYYAPSAGVWMRLEGGFTGQVAAASQ